MENHKKYYEVIKAFKDLTGYGVIVNTSFNVRGEPIVCSIQDAFKCFMGTNLDILVCGDIILHKENQKLDKEFIKFLFFGLEVNKI